MSTNDSKICSFSFDHYRTILESAISNDYRFIKFSELKDIKPEERCCILRHDIDYTPEKAKRLSEIELSLGIKSTYFFQVAAWTYNLREKEYYSVVQDLHKQGHSVGLHFDLDWNHNISLDLLSYHCNQEKMIFEAITGISPCTIVSFHNPHKLQNTLLNHSFSGIEHTYEKRFFSEIKYLSDSQGWYEGCMCGIFKSGKYPRIQLLTHPYVWGEDHESDFIQNMARLVKYRSQQLLEYMLKYHPVCQKNEQRLRELVSQDVSS